MPTLTNDDGTFIDGYEEHLAQDVRDYAKQYKSVDAMAKAGREAQQKFRERVKLPDKPEEKEKFVDEHFKDVLTAREAKRAQEIEAESAKANEVAVQASQANAKAVLDAGDAAKYEVNLELARRAFRGDHCPSWIKDGIAKVLGVEAGKLTDAQIKEAIANDPAVADTLLRIGSLTSDGRIEKGDGHSATVKEKKPIQPQCPEMWAGYPANCEERIWFENRGFDYSTMEWNGKPGG